MNFNCLANYFAFHLGEVQGYFFILVLVLFSNSSCHHLRNVKDVNEY